MRGGAEDVWGNGENEENRVEVKRAADESFGWLEGELEKEHQERGENEAGDPQVDVILKRLRNLEDGLDDRHAGEQPQSVEDSDDAEREQSQIAGFATEEEESQRRETDSENEEDEGQLGDLRPQVRDREGEGRNHKKQKRERHAGEFIRSRHGRAK